VLRLRTRTAAARASPRRSWRSRVYRALTSGAAIERVLGLAVLALCCVIRVWDPAPVESTRSKLFDLYQNLRPSQNPERPTIIVDIDDDSLTAIGQWPWPRTVIARIVDRLADLGAVAIAFDIVFAERDRNSPGQYAETMSELPPTVRENLRTLPDNDDRLAAAFARIPVVLPLAFTRQPRAPPAVAGKPPVALLGPSGTDVRGLLIGTNHVISNVPPLQRAAAGTGLITYYPERDGVVRRVPAVYRVGTDVYPSVAVELIRVATGRGTLLVRAGKDGVERLVFTGAGGAGIAVPTDRRGRLWVRASRHDPARYVSVAQILNGTVTRQSVEGRLVLIGTSATALQDIKTTPLETQIPGVEVHAQLIENILFKDHIYRPFFSDAVEFFATVVVALVLIVILPVFGAARTLVSGFSMAGILAGSAWLAFADYGLLFDITFPLATTFLVFLILSFANYFREEKQRRTIRFAFGQYLSPDLVGRLAADPSKLRLGGEMRTMTILFSDVRGFTGIAERFDAAGLTSFMNRYLTPMTEAIMTQGGTVDKYIGDAIMAFWNAPLDDANHAPNACRAALDMMDRLAKLNAELAAEARQSGAAPIVLAIGIGLNTAECCVGNMGSQQRFDYSVFGDGVNLASRLEGQTKTYGVPILIGEETQAQSPGFATIEVDLVRVKGKTAPARVYALIGGPERAQSEEFRALAAAQARFLERYRARDWDGADHALAALRGLSGAELYRIIAVYAERIALYRAAPPPPDWDGVYVAESK
jgi:adenylate cyclase